MLWKFQTKEKFNKLRLIIHQLLTFKTLWIFIKSVLQNHIFLVIDTALTWDNSSRFRKNLRSLIVTTDDKSKDEKLQFDINRKPAKISALSSSKIEYLTGKEMLWSDQIRIIQPAEFTYSPFIWTANRKNWRTRRKTIKGTWRAQEIAN